MRIWGIVQTNTCLFLQEVKDSQFTLPNKGPAQQLHEWICEARQRHHKYPLHRHIYGQKHHKYAKVLTIRFSVSGSPGFFFFSLQLFSTNYHNKSLLAKAALPWEPPVGKTPISQKALSQMLLLSKLENDYHRQEGQTACDWKTVFKVESHINMAAYDNISTENQIVV